MRWLGIAVVATASALTGALFADFDEAAEPYSPVPVSPPASGPTQSVVLVTLDGVRAREVFLGADTSLAGPSGLPSWARGGAALLLPNMHRLFFEGGAALGDPRMSPGIAASGSRHVSLPGYLEIMTGAATECRNNDCIPRPTETIADAIAGSFGAAGSASVFSSWEVIARAATSKAPKQSGDGLVSVHAGREGSDTMAPFPGNGAYRPDSATWERAKAALEGEMPRFLWIALGDTDEWAHRHDYMGYLRALRAADRALGELASILYAKDSEGQGAMLIVATDHGRDEGFADHGGEASAPVWMLARGPGIAVTGAIAAKRPRFLRDIAPTIRAALGMPEQEATAGSGEVIDEILRPGALARAAAAPRSARSIAF